MGEFVKAKIQRVTPDETETPTGDPIEVQFNPSTLRLSLANMQDTGSSAGRQRAQYLGTGSATLTVDLVFDTADEGTTAEARSVLDRTTPIEQLLLPQGSTEDKQSPAKVRFEWGQFVLTGVVSSMNLDLELFSESGVPLRAKVGLSIEQQRTEFEFLREGPGANSPGNATAPGKAGLGAVGGIGLGLSAGLSLNVGLGVGASAGVGLSAGASLSLTGGASLRTTTALQGESAAELAARVGVDPAAWRAIAAGQTDSSLELSAGASIDFAAGISAGTGMGAQTGVATQSRASIAESFGIAAPSPGAGGTPAAPGFMLAAAGGVRAALDTVAAVESESAAEGARRAFGSGTPTASTGGSTMGKGSLPAATAAAVAGVSAVAPRPERPEQARRPLFVTGYPSRSAQDAATAAPALPRPDPRAITFGSGVPLRPRLGGAADERRASLGGQTARLRRSEGASPARPSWQGPPTIPASGPSPAGTAHAGSCGCGCGQTARRRA